MTTIIIAFGLGCLSASLVALVLHHQADWVWRCLWRTWYRRHYPQCWQDRTLMRAARWLVGKEIAG